MLIFQNISKSFLVLLDVAKRASNLRQNECIGSDFFIFWCYADSLHQVNTVQVNAMGSESSSSHKSNLLYAILSDAFYIFPVTEFK